MQLISVKHTEPSPSILGTLQVSAHVTGGTKRKGRESSSEPNTWVQTLPLLLTSAGPGPWDTVLHLHSGERNSTHSLGLW